ncbi:type II secretion system protein [Deinococcus cavernae]|uniref:Type II secretion system protein n=1 Tax=Deinococcus cavernae TaxID=2320857 RepID=A0A418VGV9_9DEIO|nr:type II secretion system protein [Deinococcus cavernae]RJF75277.1 type II secretion system protein [Deinococcus cavernae]
MKRPAGFTLIELLVAAAIGILMLTVILQLVLSSRKITTVTANVSNHLDSIQGIAGTIGDDVRRASFIEPSLAAPAWLNTVKTSATQALTLRKGKDGFCPSDYQVSYYVVPRSALTATGTSEWVKLQADTYNNARQVLLRASQCGTTVDTRLVADYLEDTSFAVSQFGSTTYTSAPTSSTGGFPYLSARVELARRITNKDGSIREPSTGTVTTISTSRMVEAPAPATPTTP